MADPRGVRGGAAPPAQDIAKLAGYGPPPKSFLGAPSYAFTVRKRQKELAATIAEVNERMRTAEAERDGAEAQLGQAAVDFGIITGRDAEELKSKVAEAERSMSGARERKSQADHTYESDKKRLEEALEELGEQLTPLLERQQDMDRAIKAAEASQKRAEAMVRRVEIEARNLEQAVATGAADAASVGARKAELARQRGDLEAEIRTNASALGRAKAEAELLAAQVGPLQTRHENLTSQRDDFVRRHEERVGAATEQQKLASNWRRSRLAIIGRQVYDMDPRPKLLDAERLWGRIDQSRDKVAKVQSELELYLKAMDAYDQGAVDKSKYVLIGAGGVLAVILLALLLYAC